MEKEHHARNIASIHRGDMLTDTPFSHVAQGRRHDRQALANSMSLEKFSVFDPSAPPAPPPDDPSGCGDAPRNDNTDEHKEDEVEFGDRDAGDEPHTTENTASNAKSKAWLARMGDGLLKVVAFGAAAQAPRATGSRPEIELDANVGKCSSVPVLFSSCW